MPTYADLRSRVITETIRDDLADTLSGQLTSHIARAIEFYASSRFWFNEGVLSGVCVSGNEYAAKPSGLRIIDKLSVTIGGLQRPLRALSLVDIDTLAIVNTSGQPTDYAETGDQVRLWPKPNSAYALSFVGIVDLSALSADGDSNAWTNQGFDLITARTKYTLFRGQFYDGAKAQAAQAEEADALAKLRGETARRLSTGVRSYE